VSNTAPALLTAAAGVGFGHAILPDHWVPLAVLGRTRRYPISRIARLSGLAGVAHVLVSIVLGAVVIAVGLQFRSTVQSAQDTIIGCLLVATGLGFAALELTGHGHGHHHHDGDPGQHQHHREEPGHPQDHQHERLGRAGHDHLHNGGPAYTSASGIAAVMVPFGAAASPDLTILPVFLAAATAGLTTAIGSLVIFAAVTIGTIVGLTVATARTGYAIRGQWLERWGNVFTAFVLGIIGALVLAGVI
jgi:nickel/cobalt exporter